MDVVPDFVDMLDALEKHQVRYLVVGGVAVAFHAKPRFTKDIDILVEGSVENIDRANKALAEFGSPWFLDPDRPTEVVQVGLPPRRVDILQSIEGLDFAEAWTQRVRDRYGPVEANWISIQHLLAVKERIDSPRHQEDARVLRRVIELRLKKK